jgi:hypothetical protein
MLNELLEDYSLDIEIRAKEKLRKLSINEQNELSLLIYKNEMIRQATVQSIVIASLYELYMLVY